MLKKKTISINEKNRLQLSAYSIDGFKHFEKITFKIASIIKLIKLYNRLSNVHNSSKNQLNTPCFAPLNEILINRKCKISFCCLDWQRRSSYGDLNQQTIKGILKEGTSNKINKRLSRGDKLFNVNGCALG